MLTVPDCADKIGSGFQLRLNAKKVPLGSWQRGTVLVGRSRGARRGRPGLSALVARFLSVLSLGLPYVVPAQRLIKLQGKNGFVKKAVIIHSFLFLIFDPADVLRTII